MRIVSVTFDYDNRNDYSRLMAAFRASCERHMPDAVFDEIRLNAPQLRPGYSTGHNSNTYKLRAWAKCMEAATEPVVFCDCDMLATGDLAPAFDADFDLAYCKRTGNKSRSVVLNGGVVFVKPTDGGRTLIKRWREINEQMFRDHVLHDYWRRKYCGMNQAAFGCLLHTYKGPGKIVALPCAIWNACNEDWARVDGQTRMIHYKGDLRRLTLGAAPISAMPAEVRRVVEIWRAYGC